MRDLIVAELEAHRRIAEALVTELAEPIEAAARALVASLSRGGKVLACGNGGSAADAQHFAAELVGRYKAERRALPAFALTTDSSALTAIANDYGYESVFARQVEAAARPGDVLVAISTSGASPSVLRAAEAARASGAVVVALTGRRGFALAALGDVAILVPSDDTARVQEAHIAVIHVLCALIEREAAPRDAR